MGSVLHGSARATPCVRAVLQATEESSRALTARYGLNPKTVRKWRRRTTTADAPMLTDNGMAFDDLPKNRDGPSRRYLGPHIFDRVCAAIEIEHWLTKPCHPWTNGQSERMNCAIKGATVKVFHYDDLPQGSCPGLRYGITATVGSAAVRGSASSLGSNPNQAADQVRVSWLTRRRGLRELRDGVIILRLSNEAWAASELGFDLPHASACHGSDGNCKGALRIPLPEASVSATRH